LNRLCGSESDRKLIDYENDLKMRFLCVRQLICLMLPLAAYQVVAIRTVTHAVEPDSFAVPTIRFSGDPKPTNVAQAATLVSQTERNSTECLTPSQLSEVVPSIHEVRLDIMRGQGEVPKSCFPEQQLLYGSRCGNVPRGANLNEYHWAPSGLFSNPLYFEDVSLERYGRVSCGQNVVSGAKFFGTVAILPYKMGVDCPRERQYALGPTRAGNFAPAVCERLPCSLRGMALQASAVTGIGLLFP
jgi:hypothetical protein